MDTAGDTLVPPGCAAKIHDPMQQMTDLNLPISFVARNSSEDAAIDTLAPVASSAATHVEGCYFATSSPRDYSTLSVNSHVQVPVVQHIGEGRTGNFECDSKPQLEVPQSSRVVEGVQVPVTLQCCEPVFARVQETIEVPQTECSDGHIHASDQQHTLLPIASAAAAVQEVLREHRLQAELRAAQQHTARVAKETAECLARLHGHGDCG